jgi:hypothetical protein
MSIRDAGTTIRPSSTALLTIDSEDRFENWAEKRAAVPGSYNYNPYNFSLIRNGSLVNGYMTRLAVTEVVFPWTIPNINAKTNKILCDIDVSGVLYPNFLIEIPIEFMTPAKLALSIIRGVRLSLDNPPISRPDIDFGFTYGAGGLPRFDYSIPPGNGIAFRPLPAPSTLFNYPYPETTKQLFDVLGFTNENTQMVVAVTAGIEYPRFGQATFTQAIRYVDIVSPILTANQGLIDSTSQSVSHTALCRLYLADAVPAQQNIIASDVDFAPPGTQPFTIYRQFNYPKQIAWNAIQPIQGRISFQVYDDNGELLTPTNVGLAYVPEPDSVIPTVVSAYSDWSMTLLLSEN